MAEGKEGQDGAGKDEIILEDVAAAKTEQPATVKEAEEEGLDPREIESGKKTGAIASEKKEGDDKGDDKKEDEGKDGDAEAAKKKEEEAAAAAKAKADKEKADRRKEQRPWEKDVPKEELEAAEKYTPNEKALFWEKKKERFRRQKAEDERDQLKAKVQFLEGKQSVLEKKEEETDKTKPEDIDKILDGDDSDDEDKNKPLTKADLEKIEAEKEAKKKKAEEDRTKVVRENVKILDEQEKEFKEDHADFDKVYDRTKELLDADKEKWAELYPDPVQRRGVQSMIADFALALREPHKHTGENSAAAIAYEIGKLHPKFSDDADSDGEEEKGEREDEDSDDKSDLEQRLEGKDRPNSASQNGGSNRRPKSVHDLTQEDIANMSTDKIRALKKKYPGVVEKILRENR